METVISKQLGKQHFDNQLREYVPGSANASKLCLGEQILTFVFSGASRVSVSMCQRVDTRQELGHLFHCHHVANARGARIDPIN